LARVQSSATHDAQDALAGLLPLLANGVPFLGDDADPSAIPGPHLDDHQARAALTATRTDSPAVGPETVAVYLARLVAEGLLAPAATKAKPATKTSTNGHTHRRGSRSRTHGTK
jgi:hypothetical protein